LNFSGKCQIWFGVLDHARVALNVRPMLYVCWLVIVVALAFAVAVDFDVVIVIILHILFDFK